MRNSLVRVARAVRMAHIDSQDVNRVMSQYMGQNKNLALLLDYDGTLTPIVTHPDLAVIPETTKDILIRLSKNESVFLAIISGRAMYNVKEKVGVDAIHYAGNHGFEILHPNGSVYIHEIPQKYKEAQDIMIKELEEKVSDNGAWVEDKKFSITYHFRALPDNLKKQYEEKAKEIMNKSEFRITSAHYGLEAKPPINWNKGTAALKILDEHYKEGWKSKTKVIFIGDDTTDEDAMQALKGNALSFRISPDCNVKTSADYVLPSFDLVLDILKWLDKYYSES